MFRPSNPGGGNRFILIDTCNGSHAVSSVFVTGAFLLGQNGRNGFDHPHPLSVEIKNEYDCISSSTLCFHTLLGGEFYVT